MRCRAPTTCPTSRWSWWRCPACTNPLGVKGAGEAGAVGSPPAVINAIIDALSGDGVTHIDMPATPERGLAGPRRTQGRLSAEPSGATGYVAPRC